MAERSMIFPAQEYRARIAQLQTGMCEGGLDALYRLCSHSLSFDQRFRPENCGQS